MPARIAPCRAVLLAHGPLAVALLTSISVLGALYHFGTRRKEPGLGWAGAVPPLWSGFRTLALDGMYAHCRLLHVLRLIWRRHCHCLLYITSFSALLGAELNAFFSGNARVGLVSQP